MIKQIIPKKCPAMVFAEAITNDTIKVCLDPEGAASIMTQVFAPDGGGLIWITVPLRGGYGLLVTSFMKDGFGCSYEQTIEKYTPLGWKFFVLESTLDLTIWLTKL